LTDKKKHQFLFTTLILFLLIPNLYAVSFSEINLSNDDRLLFRANFEGQSAVFLSGLSDMSIQQITVFPEKMYLVNSGRTILALNHFGAVKIPVTGGLPQPLPGYPSFAQNNIPLKGRLQDIAPSSDGRWILRIEPVSHAFGSLLLIDAATGAKKTVSERVELPGGEFPVKWSPDSRLFVYEKGGRLFYFPVIEDFSVLIDERFRMIGAGRITSVLWGQQGNFYYFTGNTLYQVLNPELFTRTIYGDFLSIGNVAAVLPIDFNPGFDRFWIAPNSRSILINKGAKGIFFFLLGANRNGQASPPAVILPHIPIPYGAENFNVFWPQSGILTVSYSLNNQTSALRFETGADGVITPSAARTAPSSPNGALSPDGTRIIFWGETGLELWDYVNWRLIQRPITNPVFSCAWVNNRQFITGNSMFIEEVDISGVVYSRRRISLSAADESGFEENTRGQLRILVRIGTSWYANDVSSAESVWTTASNVTVRQVSLSSGRFRVFLEPQPPGHFKNAVMIRNTLSTGTTSFTAAFAPDNVFTKGNHRPQKQIALCFDLYDDDTGLQQVLEALRRFNIRATFFINGEFIRRNPLSAVSAAAAGHEMASMFYAPVDFSDTRYRLTRDFIAQGLARNEDEFFRATGRELSMFWHPPFYRNSSLINTTASINGYINVERTIDPGDWISTEDALRLNLRQIPPAEIIDQIMSSIEAQSLGVVIPVRIGALAGGRDEYLYQRINVLLDALVRSGYDIVPVSSVLFK